MENELNSKLLTDDREKRVKLKAILPRLEIKRKKLYTTLNYFLCYPCVT